VDFLFFDFFVFQIIDTFLDTVMSVVLTKTEIIGGSVDGTVRTFDMRIGREMSDNLGQPVNCISISNDGNCVLAGCLDSTLRLLDRTTGELLQVYKGHISKSFKTDCCLTNSDAHVIGGSEDGLVFFWDLVDAKVLSKFRAHDLVVTSVSYHPKEDCMLTSSVDGTIRVWKK
jgi:mitogen-activated protein kinase organizer 1